MGKFIEFLLGGAKRLFFGPALFILDWIYELIKWLFKWLFKKVGIVMHFVKAYAIATILIKLARYPLVITIMLFVLYFVFDGFSYPFLGDQTIKEFLMQLFEYPAIERFMYICHKAGVWQAASLLFYCYLFRFSVTLFIKIFSSD